MEVKENPASSQEERAADQMEKSSKKRPAIKKKGYSYCSCCVPGCCSTSRSRAKLTFHCFPSVESIREKWADAVGIAMERVTVNRRICSNHFQTTDYIPAFGTSRRRLKRFAVPNENLSFKRHKTQNENAELSLSSKSSVDGIHFLISQDYPDDRVIEPNTEYQGVGISENDPGLTSLKCPEPSTLTRISENPKLTSLKCPKPSPSTTISGNNPAVISSKYPKPSTATEISENNPGITFSKCPKPSTSTTVSENNPAVISSKCPKPSTAAGISENNPGITSSKYPEPSKTSASPFGYQGGKANVIAKKNIISGQHTAPHADDSTSLIEILVDPVCVNLPNREPSKTSASPFGYQGGKANVIAKKNIISGQHTAPHADDSTSLIEILVDPVCVNLPNREAGTQTDKCPITLILRDKANLFTYTGLHSFKLLDSLIECAQDLYNESQTSRRGPRGLSLRMQIILVFVKLKLNLSNKALEPLFGVTSNTCAKCFRQTVPLLCTILQVIMPPPTQEDDILNLSVSFKNLKETNVVTDCDSKLVEHSKCLRCRILTYCPDTKVQTVQFKLGISATGLITSITKCYTGKAFDKLKTLESHKCDRVDFPDKAIADQGFFVEDDCLKRHLILYRQRFSDHNTGQPTELPENFQEFIEHTNCIGRILQRIRNYEYIAATLKWSSLPHLEQCLIIMCAILNLHNPAIGFDL